MSRTYNKYTSTEPADVHIGMLAHNHSIRSLLSEIQCAKSQLLNNNYTVLHVLAGLGV